MIPVSSARWAAVAIAAAFLVSSPVTANPLGHPGKVVTSVHKKHYNALKSLFHKKKKKHGSNGQPRCHGH